MLGAPKEFITTRFPDVGLMLAHIGLMLLMGNGKMVTCMPDQDVSAPDRQYHPLPSPAPTRSSVPRIGLLLNLMHFLVADAPSTSAASQLLPPAQQVVAYPNHVNPLRDRLRHLAGN